ncbi:zn 2cys6 transcription factor [Diaporthe amygdali]|uniref:zn 2cys6 transcription factor n=1 Tax=Phomopsis amygdali TaxID=1214568 RepID=UPI0022FDF2CC|nr:zn 2cys6 transcription factor [Diaporthe amygdali]KAJ0117919.1 zn 2cys6 transcription factor [Diaporthe amygdali]
MAAPAPTATATTAAAPWRAQFLDHISKLDSPIFTFTSLHPGPGSSPPVPRGRTCVYRGMWASIPWNDKNNAPRNPDAFDSDCLTLTTDARMAKVPELFASGQQGGGGGGGGAASSSGGGGPVEAMFWVPETGTQWRVRGHAWVLAHADVGDTASPGAKAARDAISARMRRTGRDEAATGQWSWEKEVVGQFGNLSPGMRGSFKNPPPGTPRAQEPGPGEGLGQKVGDELLEDEVARRNFRVVVVVPEEVDTWDGKDPDNQKRFIYTYVGPDAKATRPGGQIIDGWEKVEVWP